MKSEEITIFISHTDETGKECAIVKSIVNRLTQRHFSRYDYKFNPMCWKDISPGVGDPQKDKIDPYIMDSNCKLVVMIFWTIYGSLQNNAESGMEHEYELARNCGKEIWPYFSDCKIRPSQIQPEQLAKVKELKEKISRETLHGGDYRTEREFKQKFETHFTDWVYDNYIEINGLQDKFRSQTRGF